MLVLEGLVVLHRTIQLQLLQHYWSGHRLGRITVILSGLPFLSPVDHILSELPTMTHPSWMSLHGMAHSFVELDKAVVHVISLVSFP